jgi:hypothetical protein
VDRRTEAAAFVIQLEIEAASSTLRCGAQIGHAHDAEVPGL